MDSQKVHHTPPRFIQARLNRTPIFSYCQERLVILSNDQINNQSNERKKQGGEEEDEGVFFAVSTSSGVTVNPDADENIDDVNGKNENNREKHDKRLHNQTKLLS
jgi:hypothetical protein